MSAKSKTDLDAMTNEQLIVYLDNLDKATFNAYVDADTKVRYFIAKYGDGIAKAIRGTKLYFSAIVALKMLESGYGRNVPFNSFNFGGIKYNPAIHSGYVVSDTTEVVNGKKVYVQAKFAKFASAEEGIKSNIQTLLGSRYDAARNKAKTADDQILKIAQAGYTTTPAKEYLNLMKGNIKRVRTKTGLGLIN